MLNKTADKRTSALFLLPVVFILCSVLLVFFITWWGSHDIILALGISFAVFISEALFFYLFSRSVVVPQTKPAVIWLTGLSAAGKTTIAIDLVRKFRERSVEPVSGAFLLFAFLVYFIYVETIIPETEKLLLFAMLFLGTIASSVLTEGKRWGLLLWCFSGIILNLVCLIYFEKGMWVYFSLSVVLLVHAVVSLYYIVNRTIKNDV